MAEKETLSTYQRLEEKNVSKNNAFVSANEDAKLIFDAISEGKNKYLKATRLESVTYDPVWLDKIQDALGDLGEIINNPKKVTKTVTDIVPVELAKKTGAESVRHLASHSQYVKDIDEEGNITPNKILNIGADDDYITYENRFIATLIKRLVIFVEKRYDFIVKYAPLKQTEVLRIKSQSVIDGSIVEIDSKVKVTKSAPEARAGESADYIRRINLVRKYLRYYLGSDFMKMFKNEKNVKGNILQTNIIRKNPKYNKCYRLFRYIESYDSFGIDYAVDEKYAALTDEEIHDINYSLFNSFLAMNPSDPSVMKMAKSKKFKPKVLNTIDDDVFGYMPFSNKPIEFVRVDDDYFKYEQSKIGEFEQHPTNGAIAAFEEEESNKQKELDKKIAKKNALLKRKEKEQNRFRGEQHRLIQELLAAEEESRQRFLEEIRRKENEKINEARKKLWEAGFDSQEYEYDRDIMEEERRKLQEAGLLYVDEEHADKQRPEFATGASYREMEAVMIDEMSVEEFEEELAQYDQPIPSFTGEEHAPVEEELPAEESVEQEQTEPVKEEAVTEETVPQEQAAEEQAVEEPVQESKPVAPVQERKQTKAPTSQPAPSQEQTREESMPVKEEQVPAYTSKTQESSAPAVATNIALDVKPQQQARLTSNEPASLGVLITPDMASRPQGPTKNYHLMDILTAGLIVARVQTYSSYITSFSIAHSSYMSLCMEALTSGLLPSRENILLDDIKLR